MKANPIPSVIFGAVLFGCATTALADPPSRAERAAPLVNVSHGGGKWTISGEKHKVTLTESTLAVRIDAGPVTWNLAASEPDDLLVKSKGEEFNLHLTDAETVSIVPYDTGYKTG